MPTLQNPQPDAPRAVGLIRRHPDIVHSAIDGEVVMMSIEHGEYFGLDAMGSRIWKLLENPMNLEDLCDRLVEDFDVDSDRCRREVAAFLGEIGNCGLIRVAC